MDDIVRYFLEINKASWDYNPFDKEIRQTKLKRNKEDVEKDMEEGI